SPGPADRVGLELRPRGQPGPAAQAPPVQPQPAPPAPGAGPARGRRRRDRVDVRRRRDREAVATHDGREGVGLKRRGGPVPADRVAIVTGGAGHLGGARARGLAEDGVRLALLDRDSLRLLKAVEGLRAAGATCLGHTLDLADGPEVARAVAAVTQDLGAPAILVNCAGISPKREGKPPAVE